MKDAFRAFVMTLMIALVPMLTFSGMIRADETTRSIGYDDSTPAAAITESGVTVFGESYSPIIDRSKIKQAQSFLTPPVIKLEYLLIQKIAALIPQPEEQAH